MKNTSTSVRMLFGAAIGLLGTAAWITLGFTALGTVFGDSGRPALIFLAVPLLFVAPVALGRSNGAGWVQSLIAVVISLVPATAVFLAFFLFFGMLEQLARVTPSGLTALLLGMFVAVLTGTINLLTKELSSATAVRAAGGIGLTTISLLSLEVMVRLLMDSGSESSLSGWATIAIAAIYTTLAGLNAVYFSEVTITRWLSTRGGAEYIFLGVNLSALVLMVGLHFIL